MFLLNKKQLKTTFHQRFCSNNKLLKLNKYKKNKDFTADSNRIYLYTIFLIQTIYTNNTVKTKMKTRILTMTFHLFN